jgi:hypothetical protein
VTSKIKGGCNIGHGLSAAVRPDKPCPQLQPSLIKNRILQLKVLQNAFKIKKTRLEKFFKVIDKNKYTIKKGV